MKSKSERYRLMLKRRVVWRTYLSKFTWCSVKIPTFSLSTRAFSSCMLASEAWFFFSSSFLSLPNQLTILGRNLSQNGLQLTTLLIQVFFFLVSPHETFLPFPLQPSRLPSVVVRAPLSSFGNLHELQFPLSTPHKYYQSFSPSWLTRHECTT